VAVTPGSTSVAVSPNPAPSTPVGTAVPYTATVKQTTGAGALSGSVSFTDNGTAVAGCTSLALSGGEAICPVSFPAVGTYAIAASYSGDPNFTGSSGSVSQLVTLAPAFTSAATTTGTVNKAMTFTVTTTGYPTPTLTETGALPSGLHFTANANGTATISGTPASGKGGSYPLTVKATNAGGSAVQSFVLIVDQPPAITSAGSATARIGKAFSFTVKTTGYPAAKVTESGTLPKGLKFTANANGTATISGTAASGTTGGYFLNLSASNGVGSTAQQTFWLTVSF
jgi:hypothetical protein